MQSGRIAESVDDVPTPKKPKKNHRSKSIDDTQVFHRALDALLEDCKRAREQQERLLPPPSPSGEERTP
ncbi:hypothetical protein PTSG_12959 [Salpingoeca rosetta]|uniref:Uncharacterized protein n=1 Tax=Salpingoeca rosetta (strain ATCC 50818 / BSB-021) TaxID=946362 RepID=F2UNK5_SALR5|nr:uncharacterized protein PTSG_12959 [Salpingoeca rosetta]EGD79210.1 hypothetical protein PTSG_12959 [Salpingoeca rosetta]|eukprot:XP_004989295.1 hypothetical protein PTSG_12959 [Salpingoeca rosetta]